ncbi:hypothetical protein PENTCL1PPCAC_5567, partial [Pristionchus entomophagus]
LNLLQGAPVNITDEHFLNLPPIPEIFILKRSYNERGSIGISGESLVSMVAKHRQITVCGHRATNEINIQPSTFARVTKVLAECGHNLEFH